MSGDAKHTATAAGLLRRAVFAVHLWLGVVLGLYLALVGLTGSLLVFGEAVDSRLNPGLHRVAPRGEKERAPLSRIVAAVEKGNPGARIDRIIVPPTPDATYEVRYKPAGPGAGRRKAYVDPYTGALLGSHGVRETLMGAALYLHMELLLGETGERLHRWGAVGALVLLGSGLWLWRPVRADQLRARLTVRRGASYRRLLHDLHNVFGVYTLPVLLVIVLTGAAFVFGEPVERTVYRLTGTPADAPAPTLARPAAAPFDAARLDAAVRAAAAYRPEVPVERVYPPSEPDEPLTVRKRSPDARWGESLTVFVDPSTASVLRADDSRRAGAGRRLMDAVFPLHVGAWGGVGTKAVYFLVGLAPTALLATGLLKWSSVRAGRRRNREKRAAASAPPPPVAPTPTSRPVPDVAGTASRP